MFFLCYQYSIQTHTSAVNEKENVQSSRKLPPPPSTPSSPLHTSERCRIVGGGNKQGNENNSYIQFIFYGGKNKKEFLLTLVYWCLLTSWEYVLSSFYWTAFIVIPVTEKVNCESSVYVVWVLSGGAAHRDNTKWRIFYISAGPGPVHHCLRVSPCLVSKQKILVFYFDFSD